MKEKQKHTNISVKISQKSRDKETLGTRKRIQKQGTKPNTKHKHLKHQVIFI